MEIEINEIDFTTASDDVIKAYHEYADRRYKETNPRDPLPSHELREHQLRHPNPHFKNHNFLVFDDGDIIASAGYGFENESSPSYEENKDSLWIGMSVRDDYRRKGIGSKLIKHLAKQVEEIDRYTLYGGTSEESGHSFVEKLGTGIVAQEGAENRLYMEDVDWDMVEKWAEEGPKRAEGVEIQSFDDVPDEIIEPYCLIYTETMNQQPLGEMDLKMKITPESRREEEERNKERGTRWFTMITREPNGDISGLTEIFFNEKNPHRIGQNLTGVKDRYRGRGLGKWLKAKMLLYIRENYPDVLFISTGNADDNAPMLSINTRLGFKNYRSGTTYKFDRDEFITAVGNL